jgi:tetratricopeptide (TPR) repeat protein
MLAIAIAAAAVGVALVAGGWGRVESAPFPFVWRDVALVHFLSALPLGLLAAKAIRSRCSAVAALGLAAGSLAVGAAIWLRGDLPGAHLAAGLRIALSLWLATSAALGAMSLASRAEAVGACRVSAAAWALPAAIWLIVPPVYVRARCAHDQRRLAEWIDQSRIGEAHALVRSLVALGCDAQVHGEPIAAVAARLERAATELARRSATPLATSASDKERYERARDLAMLGETEQALAPLEASPGLRDSVPGALLSGTIYQTRGDWLDSLTAYTRARRQIEPQPDSDQRRAELTQALAGVAFAERKLGDFPAASRTYQQLLALAPTADSHFLLAQFYEDTQQTGLASQHARQAARLDPPHYAARAERLTAGLRTRHFSCWQVPLD